jgi:hypothetical protein
VSAARIRQPWEAMVVSACVTAVVVVVTVCIIVIVIAALFFGLAQLQSHWP